jgi:Mrp family chromosome partitioning ATPase
MDNQTIDKNRRRGSFWRRKKSKNQQRGLTGLVVYNGGDHLITNLVPEVVSRLRQLHNRLGRDDGLPKKFGLTSALRGEGVTTIALGLGGVMAADLEGTVCVVELNWWWPKLAELAGDASRPGLAQVVAGARWEEALLCASLENLFLLPAGNVTSDESTRLAHSHALRTRLNELCERFDHLILDIPAVLATGDSLPLAALSDQIGMVVRAGATPTTIVQRALDDLKHLPVTCVVLNGEKIAVPNWLYRLIPEE